MAEVDMAQKCVRRLKMYLKLDYNSYPLLDFKLCDCGCKI